MNLIVTGKVKTGKTTWCTKYSQWLLQRKFTVGGILCPEARSNDIRIGYNIVDVQTNQSVPFARVSSEADSPGESVGNYLISYEGLEFANRAIEKALENRCDMVFIDEVGHLELAGKGTIESVRTAYRKAPNTTIVVRKSLLGRFFNQKSGMLISMSLANGLAIIPEDSKGVKAGDKVRVMMLD